MLAGSFVFGVSVGLLGVIQNLLVLVASPPARLPRLMNGLHANYAAASLLSPLAVALIAQFFPWFQASFWFTAGLGTLLLAATFRIPGFIESAPPGAERPAQGPVTGEMILFAALLSSYVVAEVLVSTRIAQFARDRLGSDLQGASLWTALFFAGLFGSRFAFTFFSWGAAPRSQLKLALGASILLAVTGIFVTPWAFLGVGLAMGPCYALIMSLLREKFPRGLERAASIGIVGTGVFIVVMHAAAGLITDLHGIHWALGMAPFFLLVALVLLVIDGRTAGGSGG